MKKRSIGILLAAVMGVGTILSGCGSAAKTSSEVSSTKGTTSSGSSSNTTDTSAATSQESSTASSETSSDGSYTQLTVVMPTYGTEFADQDEVVEAINKITREKIGCEVTFQFINSGNLSNQENLMLVSQEKIDLMYSGSPDSINNAKSGALLSIGDILNKDGQGIIDALGQDYIDAGKVNDKIYFVPTVKEQARGTGIMVRKDILEQLGMKASDIHNTDDFYNLLKKVQSNYPDMVPFFAFPLGGFTDMVVTNKGDQLTDGIGVLMNCTDGSLKVVDMFETDEYKAEVELLHKWYQEGLIYSDIVTMQSTDLLSMFQSDRAFSHTNGQKPDQTIIQSNNFGKDMDMIIFDDTPVRKDTYTQSAATYSIPYYAQNPEKSMQLLNLMYTDADLENLLNWGIEGKDYVVNADGTASYPEGVDSKSVGYHYNEGFAIGNQFLTYPWTGNDPDVWEQYKEFNKNAVVSDALGFTFDSTEVSAEYAAVKSVMDEYRKPLEMGAGDPETLLPEFIQKLKDAGIDTVIQAKQEQLDAWAAKK